MAVNHDDVLERVKRLRSLSKEADEEARELVDGERERVKKGEISLGSPLKDFVFVSMLNDRQAKELESLESKINSNIGEQVLVENKSLKPTVYSVLPMKGPVPQGVHKDLIFGLISGPLIYDIQKGALEIPSEKIAEDMGHTWRVEDGPINLNCIDVFSLGNEVYGSRYRFSDWGVEGYSSESHSSNVFVGEEVEKYFRDELGEPDTRYAGLLKKMNLSMPEDFLEVFNAEGDLAMDRMLRELGSYLSLNSSKKLNRQQKDKLKRFIDVSRNVVEHYGFENEIKVLDGAKYYNLNNYFEILEKTFLN